MCLGSIKKLFKLVEVHFIPLLLINLNFFGSLNSTFLDSGTVTAFCCGPKFNLIKVKSLCLNISIGCEP